MKLYILIVLNKKSGNSRDVVLYSTSAFQARINFEKLCLKKNEEILMSVYPYSLKDISQCE